MSTEQTQDLTRRMDAARRAMASRLSAGASQRDLEEYVDTLGLPTDACDSLLLWVMAEVSEPRPRRVVVFEPLVGGVVRSFGPRRGVAYDPDG